MRAETKKKHEMGRRFAIVIAVVATGVMALGAQTAAAAKTYNTRLTITADSHNLFHGRLSAGGGKKCEVGRLVTLFKQKPGADRKLAAGRSVSGGPNWIPPKGRKGAWGVGKIPQAKSGWRVYAKATPKVGDGFVCGPDRSPIYRVG
jgi:hypothetical protein